MAKPRVKRGATSRRKGIPRRRLKLAATGTRKARKRQRLVNPQQGGGGVGKH